MKRTFRWLLFLYLVLFPFGQLARIPVQLGELPEVSLYLTDIVVGTIAFFWTLSFFNKKVQLPPIFREFSGFFGIGAFSLLLAITHFEGREVFVASLYLLRWVAYAIFFFAAWEQVKRRQIDKKLVGNSLLLVGFFVAVFSWIGFFVYPNLRPFVEFGWDEHYLRIVGTFLDPGFTAIVLVLFLLLALGKLLGDMQEGKNKKVLLAFFLGFLTLAFTYSRSGFLALLAGVGVLTWQKRTPKIFLGVLGFLLVAILALPRPESEGVKLERTVTVLARIENWQETARIASNSPLFGVGFNTLRYARQRQGLAVLGQAGSPSHAAAGSDSSLLFVLATTGIVGLLSYFTLWTKIALRAKSLLPVITALFIHSLFLNSLFYPWVLGWLGLLFSLENFKD